MRILHVMLAPRAEGTPRLVLDWLTVPGHQQEIIFLNGEGELRPEFEKVNTWQKYNNSFSPSFLNARKVIRFVREACNERKPDLVISWSMGFSQWVHLGARQAGVSKLITHAGNAPGKSFMGKYIFTYLTCWIGSLVDAKIICCSDYIKSEYLKIPLLRSRDFFYFYNCFRKEKFEGITVVRDPLQAIMVATLEKHKDHATLLKAWQIIEQQGFSYKLLLAGAGSLEAELKQMAAQLGLVNVRFLGSRSDVPMLLNQSRILVFSTTPQEGFGTVLLEGLAAGCIVVASRVPACVETLQDGKFGTLVTAADPTQMAEAMINAFVSSMDSNMDDVRKYLAGFSPETMLANYLSIFSDSIQ